MKRAGVSWKDFLKSEKNKEPFSSAVSATLMEDYDDVGGSQTWGQARMGEIAKSVSNVIELSAGTARTARKPAKHITDAAIKAIEDGYTDFVSSHGFKDLRVAIAEKLKKENGVEVDADTEVIPTTGCQQAIDSTCRILLDSSDEALLVDPEYAAFEPTLRLTGAKVVPLPLVDTDKGYAFDVERLKSRITPRTKLLVMSNGNNPTGYLYTKEDLKAIADLAKEKNFYVLTDELYEKIVFDGRKHTSMASIPGMKERTISIMGFSKLDHISGFRIGFAVANPEIVDKIAMIIRCSTQCVPSIGQRAALASLKGDRGWIDGVVAEYKKKRDYMVSRLNGMRGVKCPTPMSSTFAFPNIRGVGLSSQEFAEELLAEGQVKVVPGAWFGRNGEGHVRISYCVSMDWISQGLDKMERTISALPAVPAS